MSRFLDIDHPDVVAFAAKATEGATTDKEKAVALFKAVRDGIRYDPYRIGDDPETYRASNLLKTGAGFCIPKAVLLCAAARSVGLECRLGFADVRNHLTSEKLKQRMKGVEEFRWHAYVLFHLDGRWLKATPAFNIEMCEKFGVLPLDFDGESDALMHPFTADGRVHMEYVLDRGAYDDLPFETIMDDFALHYDFGEPAPAHDEAFS
jgi:transglutaminase-like putative cysteine protease